jgi:hypothetical protein
MTLVSMAALTIAVLWRLSSDYRMLVGVVVSVGAIVLAARCFSAGKIAWGLLFLATLGAFTPFHSNQFSHVLVAALDMTTLALFAVSPIAFRKSPST